MATVRAGTDERIRELFDNTPEERSCRVRFGSVSGVSMLSRIARHLPCGIHEGTRHTGCQVLFRRGHRASIISAANSSSAASRSSGVDEDALIVSFSALIRR